MNQNNKMNQNSQMNQNYQKSSTKMNTNYQMYPKNEININNQNNRINSNNIINNKNQINKNNLNNQTRNKEVSNIFQKEQSIINESFSIDLADAYEKEINLSNRELNETVLEQKLKKVKNENINSNQSFCLFNQFEYEDINKFDNGQNITIQNRKREDFLKVRKFPMLSEKEYKNLKRKVSTNLLEIQNHLLNLRLAYNQFDPKKKNWSTYTFVLYY